MNNITTMISRAVKKGVVKVAPPKELKKIWNSAMVAEEKFPEITSKKFWVKKNNRTEFVFIEWANGKVKVLWRIHRGTVKVFILQMSGNNFYLSEEAFKGRKRYQHIIKNFLTDFFDTLVGIE